MCVPVASAAAELNCINISRKQAAPWRRSRGPSLSTQSFCDRGASVLIQLQGRNCFHQRFFLTKCQKRARRYILSFGIDLKTLYFIKCRIYLFKPLASYSLLTLTRFEGCLIVNRGWCLGPTINSLSIIFSYSF